MKNEKKPTGWAISVEVTEFFKDYCDATGQLYLRAQEAAMVIWPYLPADVRERALLQSGGLIPKIDPKFWHERLKELNIGAIPDADDGAGKPKRT
jgi:hypothetical protein